MITKPIGLYIHIPFCVKKCEYCDFCSFPIKNVDWKQKYINKLCEEVLEYKDQNFFVDSIFFGGGTPSLLSFEEIDRIFLCINNAFSVLPNSEITFEINPGTVNADKLNYLAGKGVNRISIGLQSIHENEMKILGRIHNYEDFLNAYRWSREAGIDNINVDLMYGIPTQTEASFKQTVNAVTSLKPDHISLYGLILEEGTPFFEKQDCLDLPDIDEECDMYYMAASLLNQNDYNHYEISNYARNGFECKHNLKYWHCEEYIGVGVAAYSYINGCRYGNSRDINEYLSLGKVKYDYLERVDIESKAYDYVMLRLRLSEGFSLEEYSRNFGLDFLAGRENIINRLSIAGLLTINNGRLSLTEKGFYVSNSILTELI